MSRLFSSDSKQQHQSQLDSKLPDASNKVPLGKKIFGWLKQIVILIVFVMVITGLMDLWRGKDIQHDNLPELQGVTLKGERVDVLAISQDKPVLVYFWGSWCPICRTVSPAVETMSAYYPVISVAMASGNNHEIQAYLDDKGYSFEVINDQQSELSNDWSVQVAPTIMVFNKGKLTSYTTGMTSVVGLWWRMLLA
ncbi:MULTISPECIES: thioredoxin domain-containing protein [unclassified Shewanella]|uniref:thioredoxin domain-containing protein n=1 Tax=unclassified Shewanella TaxID=196818 RepID=UPI000C81DBD3